MLWEGYSQVNHVFVDSSYPHLRLQSSVGLPSQLTGIVQSKCSSLATTEHERLGHLRPGSHSKHYLMIHMIQRSIQCPLSCHKPHTLIGHVPATASPRKLWTQIRNPLPERRIV